MAALACVAGLLTLAAVEDILEEAHESRDDTKSSTLAFLAASSCSPWRRWGFNRSSRVRRVPRCVEPRPTRREEPRQSGRRSSTSGGHPEASTRHTRATDCSGTATPSSGPSGCSGCGTPLHDALYRNTTMHGSAAVRCFPSCRASVVESSLAARLQNGRTELPRSGTPAQPQTAGGSVTRYPRWRSANGSDKT